MHNKAKVPRIPYAFFKWYCKKDRFEEMHGDLEEFFYERVEEQGIRKARLLYLRDVIRCCQPYAWKKPGAYSNSNVIMFKNYFKTALRSSLRNPLSTFINVFGLSVAIGVCIVVYAFVKGDHNIDRFHENKDEIFMATFYADRDGQQVQYGMTPAPLGQMLKEDFAGVEKMCRLKDERAVIKHGEHVFHQRIRFAEPEFLEMFTFPLKWGDPSSLKDPNSIILSEATALRYFGEVNPVGREMIVKFGNDRRKVFKVTGVAEPFPDSHIIDFATLVNWGNLKLAVNDIDFNNWRRFVNATFVQVIDADYIDQVRGQMDKYQTLQNEIDDDWKANGFDFHQLTDLHFSSANIRNGLSYDYTAPGRIVLPIVGFVLIALACLNYINMAIASATKRLKEIGVRKVIGANKGKVIVQFLAENIFVTALALVIGVILGVMLFIPWFWKISEAPLPIELNDIYLWGVLLFLLLFTGIISGIYPAFYISRFQAVNIFRGSVRFGKRNRLIQIFLCFQLILACRGHYRCCGVQAKHRLPKENDPGVTTNKIRSMSVCLVAAILKS